MVERSHGHPQGRRQRVSANPVRDSDGAIRGAIVVKQDMTEQHQAREDLAGMLDRLREMAVVDELTCLHNRRGFFAVAEHQLKLAQRNDYPVLLMFADVDGLKQINDQLGHHTGDEALRDAADVLRTTFRDSDLLARLGGDEFVILACHATLAEASTFRARLEQNMRVHNASAARAYTVSISTGASEFDPQRPESLAVLMNRADAVMYEGKRLNQSRASIGLVELGSSGEAR
jgi:diguanylate cyclase (GGDEF)-like protein